MGIGMMMMMDGDEGWGMGMGMMLRDGDGGRPEALPVLGEEEGAGKTAAPQTPGSSMPPHRRSTGARPAPPRPAPASSQVPPAASQGPAAAQDRQRTHDLTGGAKPLSHAPPRPSGRPRQMRMRSPASGRRSRPPTMPCAADLSQRPRLGGERAPRFPCGAAAAAAAEEEEKEEEVRVVSLLPRGRSRCGVQPRGVRCHLPPRCPPRSRRRPGAARRRSRRRRRRSSR